MNALPASAEAANRLGLHQHAAGDADDHAQNLSGWKQVYDQISARRFAGRITELWLPAAQVFVETANQRLRQTCSAWRSAVWLGLPAPRPEAASLDGHAMRAHEVAVRPGGTPFELRTEADFDLYGIVVDAEALATHLERVEHLDPKALLARSAVLGADPQARQRLCTWMDRRLAAASDQAGSALPTEQAARWQTELFGLLAEVLVQGRDAPPDRSTHALRQERVRRISAHVLDHPELPLSVADLCARFHLSRRSLQYCFQGVTGLAPLAYLRALRLNGVRRDLRGGTFDKVGDCAWEWGFGHVGQFAHDYAAQFGQRPSDTLRQAH